MIQIITTLLALFMHTTVYAAAPTPTITPAAASTSATPTLNPEIDALKSRIASKVAELKLVEKRGFIGTVTDTSDTQLTLTDLAGNTRYVDVDELTKFSSPKSNNFGISDIQKGATLGILGLYNKDSQRMLGRFVDVMNLPQFLTGAIGSIDKKNYQMVIVTNANKKVTVDIQNTTKTSTYSQSTNIAKAGFSKLVVGKRVSVIGMPESNGNINALRVIEFTDLPINPVINQGILQELGATQAASSAAK